MFRNWGLRFPKLLCIYTSLRYKVACLWCTNSTDVAKYCWQSVSPYVLIESTHDYKFCCCSNCDQASTCSSMSHPVINAYMDDMFIRFELCIAWNNYLQCVYQHVFIVTWYILGLYYKLLVNDCDSFILGCIGTHHRAYGAVRRSWPCPIKHTMEIIHHLTNDNSIQFIVYQWQVPLLVPFIFSCLCDVSMCVLTSSLWSWQVLAFINCIGNNWTTCNVSLE